MVCYNNSGGAYNSNDNDNDNSDKNKNKFI
jgi:hypothetical protein